MQSPRSHRFSKLSSTGPATIPSDDTIPREPITIPSDNTIRGGPPLVRISQSRMELLPHATNLSAQHTRTATLKGKSIHKAVRTHLGRDRFDELEASLHISDPEIQGDCFYKLEPLNSHLLSRAAWISLSY